MFIYLRKFNVACLLYFYFENVALVPKNKLSPLCLVQIERYLGFRVDAQLQGCKRVEFEGHPKSGG